MPNTHNTGKVDLKQLETELKAMTERSLLYQLLKRILTERNRWKVRRRGNPKEGYRVRKAQIDAENGSQSHQDSTVDYSQADQTYPDEY